MIKKNPNLVSEPLYGGATNPICRASWLGYRSIILVLLENGANINQCSSDGRSPLMWAAAKGDVKTMALLLDKGAKVDHEDEKGLNAFDLCVCKIIYPAALFLYQKFEQRPKSIDFYRKHVVSQHFDFELYFNFLDEGRENAHHDLFFEKAKREREEFLQKDLVVDTRETWGELFRRIRDFEN